MKISRAHALFLFFGVVGTVLSLWSSEHWFQLQLGQLGGKSFCNVSDFWNCDRATLSELGSLASIPLGVFSAAYFIILMLLSFVGGMTSRKLFLLHLPAWAVSGFLAYKLFAEMNAGCLVCLAMDASWLGAGVSALFARPAQKLRWPLSLGLIFVGLLALGIYSSIKINELHKLPSESELQKFRAWFRSLPVEAMPGPTPFVNSSHADKPIMIAEFSDFACPFCARAARSLVPYLMARPDIDFHFYPLPFDSSCHPDVKQAVHPYSCAWTRVALCSEGQNKFWSTHDHIYEINEASDPSLSESNLRSLSLDQAALQDCLKAESTATELKNLIEVSRQLKIAATPTFFIDGRRVQGIIDPRLFRVLLDEAKKLK